jgi:hypothetical protein
MGVHARKSFGHQAGRDAAADGQERAKNQTLLLPLSNDQKLT